MNELLTGMYTAPKRVERDGLLVCFAGESMTMEEARRRGLVGDDGADKTAPKRRSRKPKSKAATD